VLFNSSALFLEISPDLDSRLEQAALSKQTEQAALKNKQRKSRLNSVTESSHQGFLFSGVYSVVFRMRGSAATIHSFTQGFIASSKTQPVSPRYQ